MPKRKKRPVASFEGVDIKLHRAKMHFKDLHRQIQAHINSDLYRFRCDVYRQGFDHVYRAESAPPVKLGLSAILGDVVHNLRSALDHLAWQLVILNGMVPPSNCAFPIRDSRLRRDPLTGQVVPTPLELTGSVSNEVIRAIDHYQPYQAQEGVHPLALLRDLDNIDKHRHLILGAAAVSWGIGAYSKTGPNIRPLVTSFRAFPVSLKPGVVAAKVIYAEPYPKPDPYFKLSIDILLDDGPLRHMPLGPVIHKLIRDTEGTILATRAMVLTS